MTRKLPTAGVSQFNRSHMPHDGTDLVFIRRSDKPGMLLRGSEIMHGFAPEWIILYLPAERVQSLHLLGEHSTFT